MHYKKVHFKAKEIVLHYWLQRKTEWKLHFPPLWIRENTTHLFCVGDVSSYFWGLIHSQRFLRVNTHILSFHSWNLSYAKEIWTAVFQLYRRPPPSLSPPHSNCSFSSAEASEKNSLGMNIPLDKSVFTLGEKSPPSTLASPPASFRAFLKLEFLKCPEPRTP